MEPVKILDQVRSEMIRLRGVYRELLNFTLYLNCEGFDQLRSEIRYNGGYTYFTTLTDDCDFMVNGYRGYVVGTKHPLFRVVTV